MGAWCTWPQLGLLHWTEGFFICLRCSRKPTTSPETWRRVSNKYFARWNTWQLCFRFQQVHSAWFNFVTGDKVNASDNVQINLECTKTGGCASYITHAPVSSCIFCLSSVLELSWLRWLYLVSYRLSQISEALSWSYNCVTPHFCLVGSSSRTTAFST